MKSLFDDLGIANTDSELQALQKSNIKYDPMYVKNCVSNRIDEHDFKKRVDLLYVEAYKYLDDDFSIEIKLKGNFNSRLRELYLVSFLLKEGYVLEKDRPKTNYPDIKIENQDIFIECVASTRGIGANEVEKEIGQYCGHIDNVDIPRKLRLTTALDSKIKQFKRYQNENKISKESCCIIALNGGESSGNLINNGFASILFGIGKTVYQGVNGKAIGPYYEDRKKILNNNHTPVPNSYFLNDDNKHISGIIYFGSSIVDSNDYALEGVPKHISPAEEHKLKFIRNPFAENKISKIFLEDFEFSLKIL